LRSPSTRPPINRPTRCGSPQDAFASLFNSGATLSLWTLALLLVFKGALLLTSKAGLAVAPLIIVAVVTAYITTEVLSARRVSVAETAPTLGGEAPVAAAGTPPVAA
jgi:hypothetical protein